MGTINVIKVNQVFIEFNNIGNENSYITVTEWQNHEGYDISINDEKMFSLTHDELNALNTAVNYLQLQIND